MKCSKCGANLSNEDVYCPECGTKVKVQKSEKPNRLEKKEERQKKVPDKVSKKWIKYGFYILLIIAVISFLVFSSLFILNKPSPDSSIDAKKSEKNQIGGGSDVVVTNNEIDTIDNKVIVANTNIVNSEKQIRNFNPQPVATGDIYGLGLTGNKIFFLKYDTPVQLWSYDIGNRNLIKLYDINETYASGSDLAAHNNKVYWVERNYPNEENLMEYDLATQTKKSILKSYFTIYIDEVNNNFLIGRYRTSSIGTANTFFMDLGTYDENKYADALNGGIIKIVPFGGYAFIITNSLDYNAKFIDDTTFIFSSGGLDESGMMKSETLTFDLNKKEIQKKIYEKSYVDNLYTVNYEDGYFFINHQDYDNDVYYKQFNSSKITKLTSDGGSKMDLSIDGNSLAWVELPKGASTGPLYFATFDYS